MHEELIIVYLDFAFLYRLYKKLTDDSILTSFNKALKISDHNPNSTFKSMVYYRIGNYYYARGELDQALEYLNVSLKIENKGEIVIKDSGDVSSKRENNKRLFHIYSSLADIYIEKGDKSNTFKYLELYLNIAKKIYGINSIPMVEVYQKIALYHRLYKNMDLFEKNYQKALIILKSIYGENHKEVEVAKSLYDLYKYRILVDQTDVNRFFNK